MRRVAFLACLLALVLGPSLSARDIVEFDKLPPLPAGEDGRPNSGVAGPFAGMHNGALIVAGGATFLWATPRGRPRTATRR